MKLPDEQTESNSIAGRQLGSRRSKRAPVNTTFLAGLMLVGLTLLVFWQVSTHDFINYDDDVYVTGNEWVQGGLSGPGLVWAVTSTTAGMWHPLTWISHMVDWELFGPNPKGHHLMSLMFHTANGLLLFLLLSRLTGCMARSGFVAALFLVHPLHVESVAWVAERKDVLSGLFCMLTLLAYVRYAAHQRAGTYLLTLLAYTLGLMTKPMLVTLPFVMLLLDFWPLGRISWSDSEKPGIRGILVEKLPFLAFSAASSVITVIAQVNVDAVADTLPLVIRINNALLSYVKYMAMTIWPQDLAVLYPYPEMIPKWQALGAAILLASITFFAFQCKRRHPYFFMGWLWFLGTLIPVIGMVQVGQQAMADRYTYLPIVGLFVGMTWGTSELLSSWRWKDAALAIAGILSLTALTGVSKKQVSYWRDNISLYRHTLQVTQKNSTIHSNLGVALAAQGAFGDAILHYREALNIHPYNAQTLYNLGVALFRLGKLDEAASCYSEALRIAPRHSGAHNNLGFILNAQERFEEAAIHFEQALLIDPNNHTAYRNLLDYRARKQIKEGLTR